MGQVGPSFLKGTVSCTWESSMGFREDELIGGRDQNQPRPVWWWWCLPVILAPRK